MVVPSVPPRDILRLLQVSAVVDARPKKASLAGFIGAAAGAASADKSVGVE